MPYNKTNVAIHKHILGMIIKAVNRGWPNTYELTTYGNIESESYFDQELPAASSYSIIDIASNTSHCTFILNVSPDIELCIMGLLTYNFSIADPKAFDAIIKTIIIHIQSNIRYNVHTGKYSQPEKLASFIDIS